LPEQDRAVRPAEQRKIILSTNVAESSVTIDGVVLVIDSGLARVASHAPWSGLPTLRVQPISRASAAQRAGRAGRTRPGRCVRLYTRGELAVRPEHEPAEVARADLAEAALELFASGVTDLAQFPWFEAPPAASLAAAETLLRQLGAIDGGTVTEVGRRMLRFPVHPRLSRAIVEGERRGVAADACALAAVVGERDVRFGTAPRFGPGGARGARSSGREVSADVLDALAAYREAERASFDVDRLRYLGIDAARAQAVSRVARQLSRNVRRDRTRTDERRDAPWGGAEEQQALRMAVLAGYPDRVGRLRRPTTSSGRTGLEVVFAGGGSAMLADDAGGWDTELVAAVDVEERTEGRTTRTVVRLASSVHPDWLLELFFSDVRDETEVVWNAAAKRVEVWRTLGYHGLVLERSPGGDAEPERTAALLAEAARARGWRAFTDAEALERWLARAAFARRAAPELAFPDIDDARVLRVLDEVCRGHLSFAELERADLGSAVRALLTPEQTRALAEIAPEAVVLPGGRRVRVDYAADPPSIASRLQDFFGMASGPAVARGRVPLVLHLLAPNQRAVQVTTDLAGFWERHYPGIARELRRRYPRHSWPEDPRRAAPPAPRR
jgi:ATP-dependent helicase HrpB